ncbi:unnamed protein product [Larinioides sclopetarius]|uniref:Uncharacterized protein n=1 Tax=Larinioides sclopetarius TaxID=280406 RepID=A0AAV2BSY5_9ARAC
MTCRYRHRNNDGSLFWTENAALSIPLIVSPYRTEGRHFVEQRQPPTKIPLAICGCLLNLRLPLQGATW